MTDTIHTFETCANCQWQHNAQIYVCAGCGFELPRTDLSEISDRDISTMVGRCLEFVNDDRPDTLTRRRAVGLLVVGDRELQRRRESGDRRNRPVEPRLRAISSWP